MTLFDLITLFGGLAFFLYGMNVLSAGLERMAGSNMERYLRKITKNRFTALGLGAGVTAVIQSSSAVTVMLVGFVNSGIMMLSQAIPVIMGSNIGTTMTSWILSLTGLEGDNLFINLIKPENLGLIIAVAGAVLLMMPDKGKRRDIASILLGFGILMYAMEMMSGSVSGLTETEGFVNILTLFSNPILGVLVGAAFTAIIQSSSASVGVLQALSASGSITFGSAIPIILGQNIGTCITAVISCIGASKNAKRVAVVHLSFNIIGTVLFLSGFYIINAFVHFPFLDGPAGTLGIAIVHTIFNVATTLLLFPFCKLLEKLAHIVIRGTDKKDSNDTIKPVDERLLATPGFAVAECVNQAEEMATLAHTTVGDAINLTKQYDKKLAETIVSNEDRLDRYEDILGTTLVKIAGKELTKNDSHKVSMMLHTIGDFERLGDHALTLMKTAQEINSKGIAFSAEAAQELHVLTSAVEEIVTITMKAYSTKDLHVATQVEPLEQVIDELVHTIKHNHIVRLQRGVCTIELGFILNDLLANLGRISDHCSNIAAALLEIQNDSFETHHYLNEVKSGNTLSFKQYYENFRQRYMLDINEPVLK